ncbi:MAG: hypothetical protein L3J97_00745 [Thermoplasmata archaeon]|nr:hypothetical protein [Thermoplasmata archaeon]
MTPARGSPKGFIPAPSGSCLYHCRSKTRPRALTNARGTVAWVYTCPGGTVSTVTFWGGARRPSPTVVQRYLQSRTERSERVHLRDLRAATRHGPELGPAAERWMAAPGAEAPIRLLYWRRYPRKVGRKYSYLYACFRHGAGDVRFYPAPSSRPARECPFCRA